MSSSAYSWPYVLQFALILHAEPKVMKPQERQPWLQKHLPGQKETISQEQAEAAERTEKTTLCLLQDDNPVQTEEERTLVPNEYQWL